MVEKIKRRDFLRGGVILLSGGALAALAYLFRRNTHSEAPEQSTVPVTPTPLAHEESVPTYTLAPTEGITQDSTSETNIIPTEQPQPSPYATGLPGSLGDKFPGRVVQVVHNQAHTWNYSDQNYWDYVNQDVMNNMVDAGVMNLTGTDNLLDAWHALIPNYLPGQLVAIKVSFNNSHDGAGSIQEIDGIIEPVNAIIRGLIALGVPDSSIVVYDSSRWIPTRFTDKCAYPGVLFRYSDHEPWGEGSSVVQFNPPGVNAFTQQLSREVTQANYLINVPVLKWHGMTQLSMGMKNHYGSIENPKDLHQWSSLGSPDFSLNYNPIVDLNNNPHIRDKTILVVGDGIFAAFKNHDTGSFPRPWTTFGNQTPKSLFFSTDPVAIDCVMGDILSVEKIALGNGEIEPKGFAYLSLAEAMGLGVYERGNPWQNSYTKIDLIKNEF